MVVNTFSGSLESPVLNISKRFEIEFTSLSRVVNKDFEVISTKKIVPKERTPDCDPELFYRASKEILTIIGNLTRSAFTYADTDVIFLHYKVP